MLLLEVDPHVGQPLLGTLIGYRKLTVGNRDLRLIWRVATADRGTTSSTSPRSGRSASSLHGVITELGRRTTNVRARPPLEPTRVEPWLAHRLVHTTGIDPQVLALITSEEAVDAWIPHRYRGRTSRIASVRDG